MDCIFCKIINKEIPSYVIYEDDVVLAILDISQSTKGHTLVIPKHHVKNLYELDSESSGKIFERVPMLARAIKEAFNPIGLNVLINTDKPLQSVFHFHIHLIPRYEEDNVGMAFENNMGKLTIDEYVKRMNLIKQKL